MAVYVDQIFAYGKSATWKWNESCHMFADSVDELNLFADSIGMKRSWLQAKPRHDKTIFYHYDLTATRRKKAVKAGAIELDRASAVKKWREIRSKQHEIQSE